MNLILELVLLSLFLPIRCTDCKVSCQDITINEDMSICLDNCNQKKIVMYACFAITTFFLLICAYFSCIRSQFICRKWRYRQLSLKYNKGGNALTPQQLNQSKDLFVKTALKSKLIPNFLLRSKSNKVELSVSAIRTKKVNNLLHSIKIDGQSKYGNWKAKGSILSGEIGLKMWFLVEHQESEIERGREMNRKMLLEGSTDRAYGFKGIWKGEDEEVSREGDWILIAFQTNLSGEMESLNDIA